MSSDVMSEAEAEAILSGLSLAAYEAVVEYVNIETEGTIPSWCDVDQQQYRRMIEYAQKGILASILGNLAKEEFLIPSEVKDLREGDMVLNIEDGQVYTVFYQANRVRVYLEGIDGWICREKLTKI